MGLFAFRKEKIKLLMMGTVLIDYCAKIQISFNKG
jgi:hypothetical protein